MEGKLLVLDISFKTILQTSQIDFNKTFGILNVERMAYTNFIADYNAVEKHNIGFDKGTESFNLKVNSRAEFDLEEKRKFMSGFTFTNNDDDDSIYLNLKVIGKAYPEPQPYFQSKAPAKLDYRELGYVTEVVDQGWN